MAIFTAIGAAVVAWAGGVAVLGAVGAAVLGGLVATGAALLTSRLINGSPGAGGGAGAVDQGVRIQLSPDTENKIPVLYGEAFCAPILIDAYLNSSDGKTQNVMTYVMVISETCNVAGAAYTVGDIFWNDNRLIFGDASDPSKATKGVKYVEQLPNQGVPEDFEDINFLDHVWVNVYAGNAFTKIFGLYADAANAVNRFGSNWDSTSEYYGADGLVFAVLHVKYNSEKGFTGLPQMTFKVRNSVDNPAAVFADYMSSDRYGANIPQSSIDQTALAAFEDFCDDEGPYIDINGDSTTGKRYTINGLINTNLNCLDNINTIMANSGAWLSYDVSQGKWRVVPKRALPGTTWSGAFQTGTPTDPAPQIIFNDDNIISGIEISSTRLDNLFNAADISYYDKFNKDQRGFTKIDLPDELRNYNEPDNSLNLSFELVNNNVQAERLANIELKQSRDDLVITFTTSHFGIQAQAGDVISVYNTLYGWSEPSFPQGKYFRVLTTTEAESEQGGLTQQITALEYNSDVYSNENITEFTTSSNIGIIPRNSNPNIPAPIVTIGDSNPNSGTPSFIINVQIPATGGPYDKLEVWYAEGDDWAGIGGDVVFKGQIFGTILDVIQITNGGTIRASAETPGVFTRVTGQNVLPNTSVVAFGATLQEQFGNGKTGQYTVTPSHATNTGIKTMRGFIQDAAFTGTIVGTVLTVTSVASGTIQLESLVRDPLRVQDPAAATLLTDDTVIKRQLSGTTGGIGTYQLDLSSTITTAQNFITSKPYPGLGLYERLTTLVPQAGIDGLYESLDIREVAITTLPPNSLNKKYFIKCRLGIGDDFGEFSNLSEVDLEPPVVFWNPDSQSALNIKEQLVKMDFGKFTIPRNGLWLMRTAMQLDGGTLLAYNTDYFNLDLGNFDAENEITSADDIQDFTFDPDLG